MNASTLLKIGFTILLFYILFTRIDPSHILKSFESLDILLFTLAMSIMPILLFIRTYKWNLLLSSMGIRKPYLELLKILLIGVFYGLITPGKVGELGRVYHLKENRGIVLSTVLIEKITDLMVLIFLSIVTISIFFQNHDMMIIIISITIALIGVTLLLVNKGFLLRISRILKIPDEHTNTFASSTLNQLKNSKLLLSVFLLTLAYYAMAYILSYFLILAIDVKGQVIVTLPLLVLMGNIPITISGLGLREAIGSYCFLYFGETAASGFAFSLLLFIIITLIPGVCGYLLVIQGGNYE